MTSMLNFFASHATVMDIPVNATVMDIPVTCKTLITNLISGDEEI